MKIVFRIFFILFICGFLTVSPSTGFSAAVSLEESQVFSNQFNYKKSLKIIKKLPDTGANKKYLAWGHLKAGNYYEASEIFLKCEQNNYEILFGLGLSYFLHEDYETAYLYFSKCLNANKNCAAAEYFRGEIKDLQGFQDDAVKHYKAALKLDYNFVEARLKLAEVYTTLKNYNDSFREWSTLLNVDPQLKTAQFQKQNLLALITKTPDEILPPKRVIESSAVSSAPNPEKIPLLRLGILKNAGVINLWSDAGVEISENDKIVFTTRPKEIFNLDISSEIFKNKKFIIKPKIKNSTIVVRDIKYAGGFAWSDIADREYRGFFEIISEASGFSLVNIVNIEEYLYSVLPSEMISWWPEEALKTQAVISRSMALFRKNYSKPHRKDNFDLCDDQHCQVYKGVKQETASAIKAVNATRGEILEYNGKIAHTLYSSNCSGHTQSSKNLKGWGDIPYWQGVTDGETEPPKDLVELDRWLKHPPDIFCAPSKYTYYAESRWIREIGQEELSERLNRNYKLGGIKKIIPLKRSNSGHINHLLIEGTKGKAEIEKENLIRGIALGRLRSTNFIVEGYGKKSGLPKYFIFWGAGWGHAVGLCQSGAAGMAEKKHTYSDILKKYYKDTYIKKIDY